MAKKNKSGKRWSEDDEAYVRDNYLTTSNKDMAIKLGRTTDAVRKQLNFMKLRRPRKYELDGLDRKVTKDKEIFKALREGEKTRKKRAKVVKQVDDTIVKLDKRPVKKKETKVETEETEKVEEVWITVDSKGTRIKCKKGEETKTLEAYKRYLDKKKF